MDYKVGITGNYYYTSAKREALVDICRLLGKAESSIYWNTKYQVFVIRIKSDLHKKAAKILRDRDQGNQDSL